MYNVIKLCVFKTLICWKSMFRSATTFYIRDSDFSVIIFYRNFPQLHEQIDKQQYVNFYIVWDFKN